jgi:hypothetical protein
VTWIVAALTAGGNDASSNAGTTQSHTAILGSSRFIGITPPINPPL